ncbi:MAG: hypothetical protein LBR28_00770 [Bacteroidales bacterium]|nr:hypothetical protein [Bacteroidales bacterium]
MNKHNINIPLKAQKLALDARSLPDRLSCGGQSPRFQAVILRISLNCLSASTILSLHYTNSFLTYLKFSPLCASYLFA